MLAHKWYTKPLYQEEHVLQTMNCCFFSLLFSLVLQWLLIQNKRLTSDKIRTLHNAYFCFFFISIVVLCFILFISIHSNQTIGLWQQQNMLANDTMLPMILYGHKWYGKLFNAKLKGKKSSTVVHLSLAKKTTTTTFIDDMTYFH